ncbi:MAG: hypothetical protein ACTHNA_01510 [Sphingopyxis terrae]|uniref:hypothetical protein n=1 Tax=Sphingopyxis terrae TaxID=33052 RepID=UPI003F81EBE8
MTRLPLAMLILAGAAIAQPAAAQDTGPVGPANEKINQVIVYGNDKCPEANGDEILVCAVLPEGDRYRVPQIFRGGDPLDPRNEAWVNRVVSLQRVGRFGTDSCSPVGLGGFTGCTQQLLAGAKAERQAADKTDWQAMIADERAKRLAGIDAAADTVEAAVVAEEKALADRQKQAEETAPATDASATDNPDAEPLPVPPPR